MRASILIGLFLFATTSHAQLVIDSFTTAQTVTHTTGPSTLPDEVSGGDMIGGVRMIRLTNGAAGITSSGTVNTTSNELTLSTDGASDLEIWWDGVDNDGFDSNGLAGQDLTMGGMFDRIAFNVVANDRPTEDMRLQVWNADGRCEAIFTMPVGMVEVLFSSLGSCSGTATVNGVTTSAGLVLLRTVNRPGAWSFTLGPVDATPVELLEFDVH